MTINIVQLTDLHLYKDPQALLAGVATWTTFRAVLEQVRDEQADLDYLILTGDLAQDEALETYLMLREALGKWIDRCRIIPGNHDDRSNLREAFPEFFPDNDGPLTFTLAAEAWRIIGLDSHVPGEVKGRIDAGQLNWLKTQLANGPNARTLVFIHHPPIPINVAWIDEIGLNDAAEFIELIEASPQVDVVCAGHVHQEFTGRIGTASMYTTPSTCVQFGARAEKTFDTSAAGYRSFKLGGYGHSTAVHRLSDR
ncbi:MAG: phosphodiesterase [Gammaproteobacteria bacterium]|nr:phosphodiesterase [Gammaproteobacteria bacterium]